MILAVQLMLAAVFVLCIPLINPSVHNQAFDIKVLYMITLPWTVPITIVYFVNFYGIVPYLFERKKYLLFFLANILLILICNFSILGIQYPSQDMYVHAGLNMFVGIVLIMNIIIVGLAVGVRYVIRANRMEMQLQEVKQKNAEAELAWLRNQLNPHFLFNALNNISSLTQIDADAAQNSIAQLSDLLRYAMYETCNERVALEKDVEFMENYIAMMTLRCSDKTRVTTSFNIENPDTEIAPMLFISLVENAFKHGVSNNHNSFVDIKLTQRDNMITFVCRNSDFHKTDKDRSGKGVGIENTKRRLNLLYCKKHSWQQLCKEGIYETEITINTK